MKKSIAVLVLFLTLTAYSNEVIRVKNIKGGEVTSLFLEDVEQGSVLLVKDKAGRVLYRESILDAGVYSKGFDLTSLPNGAYYFELESTLKIVEMPFNVVAHKVAFKKEEKNIIYKPVFQLKDEKVFVSRSSFNLKALDVVIYDAENNEPLVEERFENKQYVQRIYDFSKLKSGIYSLVLRSEGREFVKKIHI